MRPKGNGLIPLHDEKQEERGFFDRYVYFTNRTGDVQYSYQKRVGKATKNVKVQTMCNNNGQENKH